MELHPFWQKIPPPQSVVKMHIKQMFSKHLSKQFGAIEKFDCIELNWMRIEAKCCLSSLSVWFKTSFGARLTAMVAQQHQGFNRQTPCLKHPLRNTQKIAAFLLKQCKCLFLLLLQTFHTGVRPAFSEWRSCWAAVTCLWREYLCIGDMRHRRCFMNWQPWHRAFTRVQVSNRNDIWAAAQKSTTWEGTQRKFWPLLKLEWSPMLYQFSR